MANIKGENMKKTIYSVLCKWDLNGDNNASHVIVTDDKEAALDAIFTEVKDTVKDTFKRDVKRKDVTLDMTFDDSHLDGYGYTLDISTMTFELECDINTDTLENSLTKSDKSLKQKEMADCTEGDIVSVIVGNKILGAIVIEKDIINNLKAILNKLLINLVNF